jgi:hypothetical protein
MARWNFVLQLLDARDLAGRGRPVQPFVLVAQVGQLVRGDVAGDPGRDLAGDVALHRGDVDNVLSGQWGDRAGAAVPPCPRPAACHPRASACKESFQSTKRL